MSEFRKHKNGDGGNGFLYCLITSAVMIVVFSFFAALGASLCKDQTGAVGLWASAGLLVAATVSGIICSRIAGESGRLKVALLCPFTVILIMLLISVLWGETPGISALINYGCYFGAFALAFLLVKPKERRQRKHTKLRRV